MGGHLRCSSNHSYITSALDCGEWSAPRPTNSPRCSHKRWGLLVDQVWTLWRRDRSFTAQGVEPKFLRRPAHSLNQYTMLSRQGSALNTDWRTETFLNLCLCFYNLRSCYVFLNTESMNKGLSDKHICYFIYLLWIKLSIKQLPLYWGTYALSCGYDWWFEV